ncbi:MAG: extracellular solute-binding protein [Caldilineaceae bacterium]|nr:extracellular solute-binding protein [Caldilineaceae bacterium]MCB0096758.1 extracellular solute-binding protein [Caldilineaceae bacterium]MCB9157866.1 extracellular solute-binding protein [Caldilineaceae bacterium]
MNNRTDQLHNMSRRQFLMAAGGVTVAAALAACAVPAPGGDSGGAASSEAQQISFLVRPDIRNAYAADAAAEAWNQESEQKIVIDEPAGAADQKIQAAVAAGDLIWDGFAVIEGPWGIESWVSRDLIQPLDDLIAVSTVADADKVVPAIIPSVLESSKYEGKQYTIPGNVGSVALGWFWEPLNAAGAEPPETWDEVRAAAEAIKASSPDWTPFDAACSPLCDHISMIWGATDAPLTDEGLVDWTGEASIAALKWKQEMVAAELMPGIHGESFGNWLKGGTAIMTSYDVHGTMAQQTFGEDAATTGLNIKLEKDDIKAGAPFWLNGSVVLNGANNAQGMMDFLLWWFGPNNKATGEQIATVAAKPAYQYTYDDFIKGNSVQAWQLDGIELVRESVPFPVNLFWGLQNSAAAPWIEKALDPGNNMSAEEAMESALAEMHDEMAKMKQG